ncbi:MAG: nucleotidyltransferase domain-containing protein [Saprospiraceae bacterium]|nr:nucleotidyltransferase domain-containing protein [Saprospiraceae bacterium]
MEQKIKKYLSDLEKEKGIEILLACETGSRAWGFPSPDSDFDVRVIYKHHKNWYLGLTEEKDTIEYFFENNEIDISGWDLRKSLRLLAKSNAPLLERIQSPIIYKVDNEFLAGINAVAQKTYSRIATIHHYLSMAKKLYSEIENSEEYKLKKLFYALRASVACLWILEKEEIPPIEFAKMVTDWIWP